MFTKKSITDERLIIDVVVPGFGSDMITVKTARVNGGDTFKVIVEGKYKGRTNANGKPVPRVAFEKLVEDFKYTFSDDSDFGDKMISSNTFNVLDYDLDGLVWDVRNGVIRISIPKTTIARGKVVSPVQNADADSTGVVTSDVVTSDVSDAVTE